jgi:hypothetical protein
LPANIHFKIGDKELEIVNYFLYLGIQFSRSGSFSNVKKELVNKGIKATKKGQISYFIHKMSIRTIRQYGQANNSLWG